jgi:5-formyltetrahydrofolate cyclo-ligase
LYSPAHNETDTAIILTAAFEDNKRVLFPAVCGQNMVLRLVKKPDDLQEGAFGILEPKPSGVDHNVAIVDLVVVPGIAFDLTGHRIGYGKGYYDRFLQHPGRTTLLVGFCHDFQMVYNPLPADVHDVPMDVIVTDKRIIRLKK